MKIFHMNKKKALFLGLFLIFYIFIYELWVKDIMFLQKIK